MNNKLRTLLFSNTIFVFAGNLFVPLYALLVVQVGGGIELAGLLVGIQYITMFLIGLFVVQLKDGAKTDRKLLQANYLLRGSAWLLLALHASISTLIIAQIMQGISEAIGTPAYNASFSENLDKKKHIKEWGIAEIIKNPIIALASVLGGLIVVRWGFQLLFFSMSVLAVSSFLLSRAMTKKK